MNSNTVSQLQGVSSDGANLALDNEIDVLFSLTTFMGWMASVDAGFLHDSYGYARYAQSQASLRNPNYKFALDRCFNPHVHLDIENLETAPIHFGGVRLAICFLSLGLHSCFRFSREGER